MNLNFALAALITLLVCSIVGFFIFFRANKKNTNRYYSELSFLTAFWAFGIYMHAVNSGIPSLCLFWGRFAHVGASFIPLFYLLFITSFLDYGFKFISKIRMIGIPIASVLAALSFHPGFIPSVSPKIGLDLWADPGYLYPVFVIYFSTIITLAIGMLAVRTFTMRNRIKKVQSSYILAASMLGFLGGSSTFFAVYSLRFPLFNESGLYLVALYNFIIAYAIIRYRLLDIKMMVIRVLLFLSVYIPLLTLPILLGLYQKNLLRKYFSQLWWVVPCVIMGLFAIGGLYVFLYLKQKTDEQLMAKKIRYIQAVHDFVETVKQVRTLGELIDLVLDKTTGLIKAGYTAFYLVDRNHKKYVVKGVRETSPVKEEKFKEEVSKESPLIKHLERVRQPVTKDELRFDMATAEPTKFNSIEAQMHEINASVIIPVLYQEDLLALLVLGNGRNENFFSEEDIEAFGLLGSNIGLSIKNALYLEDINRLNSDLLASERLAAIGRLATSAKHEISNPLNLIYGSFQQAMMDIKDKQNGYKRSVQYLKNAIDKTQERSSALKEGKKQKAEESLKLYDQALKVIAEAYDGITPGKLRSHLNVITEGLKTYKESLQEIVPDDEKRKNIEELIHIAETSLKFLNKVKDFDNVVFETLEKGFKSAGRIAQAVNAIYHLPKELEGEAKPLGINELIEDSFNFTGYQSYWENLADTTIEKNIPEDIPKVRGYFNRLVSVFSNLFLNAYQAMTAAELTTTEDRIIKITAAVANDDADLIEVSVSNRGPAIPEEEMEKIFRQGYSTKDGNKGVGLDICKTQIEVFHNGEIFVRNIEGFGPEFVVRLPVWIEEEKPDESE